MITFQKWQLLKNYLKVITYRSKILKAYHLLRKTLVILISKSQSQIYNISLQNYNFPEIAGFGKFI